MVKASTDKAGIALLIVLSTIILVTLLALVMLRPLASHARLTHHQVSRIQAYYAALAGMNYAYDRLRVGDPVWPIPTIENSYTFELTSIEGNFPHSINSVLIAVAADNDPAPILDPNGNPIPGCNPCNAPAAIPACICTTVDYTYTP